MPRKLNKLTQYWLDHYVNDAVHLCSLCGNSGVIDTTFTAISAAGIRAGRKNWCICPNGQAYRANASVPSVDKKLH